MKKVVLILAGITLVMAACKKDRVCSCKTVTHVKVNGSVVSSSSYDQDYTLQDASYKSAYYYCTHKKMSDTLFGATYEVDENCSLK